MRGGRNALIGSREKEEQEVQDLKNWGKEEKQQEINIEGDLNKAQKGDKEN